jgi:hypothetical protein
MIKHAVPLLQVSNAMAAQEFYCKRLGSHQEFGHGPNDAEGDPCHVCIFCNSVWVILSSFSGDCVAGGQ